MKLRTPVRTEHFFAIWTCIRIRAEFCESKTILSTALVVYTAVRSKANILMLIIFVVILACYAFCFLVGMLG